MYSYALLEKGCYYLIQEKEEGPVGLNRFQLVRMGQEEIEQVATGAEGRLDAGWKHQPQERKDLLIAQVLSIKGCRHQICHQILARRATPLLQDLSQIVRSVSAYLDTYIQ